MDTSYQILANREVGQIPVSIGTSLALESAFGILPDHETKDPEIHKVTELWINLRTLLRNVIASVPSEEMLRLSPESISETIDQETHVIESAVSKASQGSCRCVFYVCSFKSLARKFPKAILKAPNTEKQKFQKSLENNALKPYFGEESTVDVRLFDTEIKAKAGRSLILTHQPIDLLSRYSFQRLLLLESHTGKIKGPSEWPSKLTGGKNLDRIPFNRMTLQLFGDGVHFSTFPIKLKKELIKIAENDNWTSITTEEKIKYSLSKIYDPQFKALLFAMM